MTRAIKITIIVTLLLTVVREMAAQEKNQIHKTEVSVDFRWDWAVIDFDYMGTGKTLSNLRAFGESEWQTSIVWKSSPTLRPKEDSTIT